MNHGGWIYIASAVIFAGVLIDDIRLRWKNHRDWLAKDAARRLGGGEHVVDGITMPDPNDDGWREKKIKSADGGEVPCLVLRGVLAVDMRDGEVFMGGSAQGVSGSHSYGKEVIRAHRQRIVNVAKGPTP